MKGLPALGVAGRVVGHRPARAAVVQEDRSRLLRERVRKRGLARVEEEGCGWDRRRGFSRCCARRKTPLRTSTIEWDGFSSSSQRLVVGPAAEVHHRDAEGLDEKTPRCGRGWPWHSVSTATSCARRPRSDRRCVWPEASVLSEVSSHGPGLPRGREGADEVWFSFVRRPGTPRWWGRRRHPLLRRPRLGGAGSSEDQQLVQLDLARGGE